MFKLNLPDCQLKIRPYRDGLQVYDFLRRRYVALTPEEWVRQHFTHFLVHHKGYPAGLLGNEVCLRLGHTDKRCDTVLYRRDLTPRLIVEYKSPMVEISPAVFSQVCRYNAVLRADYLMVSNGLSHFCCCMYPDFSGYDFLPDIPLFTQLRP